MDMIGEDFDLEWDEPENIAPPLSPNLREGFNGLLDMFPYCNRLRTAQLYHAT